MRDRIHFPEISPDAFVSDADHWALDKLRRVPLLPTAIRKLHEYGFDRWMYVHNMGVSVRCGPRQYGTLYGIMQECCKVLDMPEPELYVSSYPFPNAFAGGIERPYITVHNSMIETLTDEQLFYLVGHELGHIKAEHVLYFTVGSFIFQMLSMVGQRTFGASDVATYALVVAFFEWVRQAEYSADRAGLLCSQSLDDTLDSLLALTAGPNRMVGEASRDAFLEQARAYQNTDSLDQIGKAIWFYLINWRQTHPFPVARAQELDRWVVNGGYQKILDGDYAKVKKPAENVA